MSGSLPKRPLKNNHENDTAKPHTWSKRISKSGRPRRPANHEMWFLHCRIQRIVFSTVSLFFSLFLNVSIYKCFLTFKPHFHAKSGHSIFHDKLFSWSSQPWEPKCPPAPRTAILYDCRSHFPWNWCQKLSKMMRKVIEKQRNCWAWLFKRLIC